jgi:hypothetical protein
MNKYFVKRGNKTITINFNGEKLDVEISIPTNREHNELMEKYTDFDANGIANVRISEMAESQLLTYIVNLPFEVPVNQEMNTFKIWSDCDNSEKKIALDMMDSKLYDAINNGIVNINGLSEGEAGNSE